MDVTAAGLRQSLSRVKPWVAAAILLGAALAIYSGVIAERYLEASGEAGSLQSQIAALSSRPPAKTKDFDALQGKVESSQQQLEELKRFFAYPDTDALMAALSATAQQTSVALERIDISGSREERQGKVQYVLQPIAVTLSGETPNIYRFLSALQERVPVGRVATLGLSGQPDSASAQLQLVFYLSPEAAPAK